MEIQVFNGKEYKLYRGERYFSRGNKRLHRVVWEYHNGKIPKGYEIHHKDENTHNNNIDNLNLVHKTLHQRFTLKKRIKENPEWFEEYSKKGRDAAAEWHKTEEGIEQLKEASRISWLKRELHKKNCEICNKEYETPFPTKSKYCHQNCRAKALRQRNKNI
jgi:hypothetical protein